MGRIEHLYAGKLIDEEAYTFCIYTFVVLEVGNWFLCVSKVLYCIADLISSWNWIGS